MSTYTQSKSNKWFSFKSLFLCSLVVIFSMKSAIAEPDLTKVISFDEFTGVQFFQDHQSKDIFYYVKTKKRLVKKNGQPDFHYSMNRFIGNRLTENENAFSVKGVVKLQTTFASPKTNQAKLLSLLKTIHIGKVILKPAPISNTFNKLNYALINSSKDVEENGEVDGGFLTNQSGEDTDTNETELSQVKIHNIYASKKQRFTIGLDGHDANLFWEGFSKNKLILSLSYGWEISGVIPDNNNGWKQSTVLISDSLPIDVSFKKNPELFKKNELWQRVKHAYSTILVNCYDFINAEYSDLYYVKVELRFTTLRNQQYVESVKFTADSDEYEKNVRFKQVNDIENGYEYRVRRLFNNGDQSKSAWIKANNRVIDASLTLDEIRALQKNQSEQL